MFIRKSLINQKVFFNKCLVNERRPHSPPHSLPTAYRQCGAFVGPQIYPNQYLCCIWNFNSVFYCKYVQVTLDNKKTNCHTRVIMNNTATGSSKLISYLPVTLDCSLEERLSQSLPFELRQRLYHHCEFKFSL